MCMFAFALRGQVVDSAVPGIMDTGGTSGSPATYIIGDTSGYNWALSDTGDSVVRVGNTTDYNQLTIQNGATANFENAATRIGSASGSDHNSITVTGVGTSLTNGGEFIVGSSGSNNSLTVSASATAATAEIYIGVGSGTSDNSLLVTGSGSDLSSSNAINVGFRGTSHSLTISSGGTVSSANGHELTLGWSDGSASVVVTGSGSTLTIGSYIRVGQAGGGNNSISVLDGGSLSLGSDLAMHDTANNSLLINGSSSSVNLSGIQLGTVSTAGNTITVSDGGILQNTHTTFTVASGSFLRIDDGYIAWSGDHESDFASFISGSSIQISDGAGGWMTATSEDLFYDYFNGDDTAAQAFSGYSNLGNFTIIGLATAVPEPSACATALGGIALAMGMIRRKRESAKA